MDVSIPDTRDDGTDSNPVLRTLLMCDLVDSTGLVERLGDRAAAELIRKHDRLARTIADRHGGREIDKTDGFLMMFERPIQAVAFALDYQRGLRQLNAAEGSSLSTRVGIHVGDVMVWNNSHEDVARGAKPTEVEGLVKPITSRLMNLALPNQILLSNIAYVLAHRAQGELGIALEKVRWRTHGRYRFRGVPDPVPVFEVGEDGLAPLKAPPWSSKAHREVPFWRRPATLAIEGLVALALLAIPLYSLLRPEPAIAFANRDWVVVGSLNNLTGESVFDEALESALRIGLEQSKYVNVLPDLKVRDTVARMQRDPDATKVDRAVGSEVAIRDGAKALILPTVAEIGGRVRITAEVIDPHTQATVYSESADGIGAESVLGSLDALNGKLRLRLGEALATVSNETMPLEKVATKNLDALRLYSRAVKARVAGDDPLADTLIDQTLLIDPRFAHARIERATDWMSTERRVDAQAELRAALLDTDRLAPRDRLVAEAQLADFVSPAETLRKWKALAVAYPDFFRAQGEVGYYAWNHANDYTAAIAATRKNVVNQNPHRGVGLYLLGILLAGEGDDAEALQRFAEAEAAGTRYQNHYLAAAHAIERRYERIPPILAEARAKHGANDRIESRLLQANLAIDQGQWQRMAEVSALLLDPKLTTPEEKAILAAAETGLRQIVAGPGAGIEPALRVSPVDDADRTTLLLFHAWLAARADQRAALAGLGERLGDSSRFRGHPAHEKMHVLIEAEKLRLSGEPTEAVARVRGLLDGTEPYAAHVALMQAAIAAGDFRTAREEARWLAGHRGRAYTEASAGFMFRPFNVAQSNLALLDVAECALQLGDTDDAAQALRAFRKAWPEPGMPAWIAARVGKVEASLAAGSGLQS